MTLEDATSVLRESCGLDVEPHGYFEGGEVGAADVRSVDGSTRYVLKWWSGVQSEAVRPRDLVDALRLRGYPVPRFVVADAIDGVVFIVQEFVGGAVSDTVSVDLVERLVQLNRIQVGVVRNGGDHSFREYIERSLTHGCEGYCLHQPLREYDARTRRLLRLINDAAGSSTGAATGDIAHTDFHHRNVLRNGDDITAVIDWEGCRAGDAAFDLVTLGFGLSVADVPAAGRVLVWEEVLRRTDAAERRAYVAHMALRQVDWSIRYRTSADVDHWLHVASEWFEAG